MNLIKTTIKRLANQFGFEIVRSLPKTEIASMEYEPKTEIASMEYEPKTGIASIEYEQVFPAATYSPWNTDNLFQSVLASIDGSSLVDKYRCFELWKLVEQSAKLEKGSIIEIGVWRGGTGALIARQAKNCGIEDRVFLCDTFKGVVKTGVNDSSYNGGEHSDTSRQIVEELVFSLMNLGNIDILEGIFPDQTGHLIENLQFRFCHIDVDVYQSAKDIVDWIWDKMVYGGIIVYDDYGFNTCNGITKYVEEQIYCRDRLVIHNLNGHAIIVKLKN